MNNNFYSQYPVTVHRKVQPNEIVIKTENGVTASGSRLSEVYHVAFFVKLHGEVTVSLQLVYVPAHQSAVTIIPLQ